MSTESDQIARFLSSSRHQHQPGLERDGKRYKQHSHAALTSIFDQLLTRIQAVNAIEVGAFQAEFSRRFVAADRRRKALAVEANPYNFNAFKESVESAGVSYHHAAVQDQSGTSELQLMVTEQDQQNGYIRGNNSLLSSEHRPETRPLPVPAITLDALVQQSVDDLELHDLTTAPTVLWIDVEGALDRVIKGGQTTLPRAAALFTEVETIRLWDHQAIFPEIAHQLATLGFVPWLRDCEYEPEQFNVIFINVERVPEQLQTELETEYECLLRAR